MKRNIFDRIVLVLHTTAGSTCSLKPVQSDSHISLLQFPSFPSEACTISLVCQPLVSFEAISPCANPHRGARRRDTPSVTRQYRGRGTSVRWSARRLVATRQRPRDAHDAHPAGCTARPGRGPRKARCRVRQRARRQWALGATAPGTSAFHGSVARGTKRQKTSDAGMTARSKCESADRSSCRAGVQIKWRRWTAVGRQVWWEEHEPCSSTLTP